MEAEMKKAEAEGHPIEWMSDGTDLVGGDKKEEGVRFHVWVEIEQEDDNTDEHTTLDAPGGKVATFDTYAEAWEFAKRFKRLNALAEGL
jgi:hypothetical protein